MIAYVTFKSIYPKINCESCLDQITDDILYEPKCNICEEIYGFTELYEQNHFIIEIYELINNQFVFDMGLAKFILENISDDDIEIEGGVNNIIRKLSLIKETQDKAKKGEEEE